VISSVREAVEPPAPQVISTHRGFSIAIHSILSYKFSTPKGYQKITCLGSRREVFKAIKNFGGFFI